MGVGRKLQIAMELVKSDKATSGMVVVLLVLALVMVTITGAYHAHTHPKLELADARRLPGGSWLPLSRIRRQTPPKDTHEDGWWNSLALGITRLLDDQEETRPSNGRFRRHDLPLPGWWPRQPDTSLPNGRFKRQTLLLNAVRPAEIRYHKHNVRHQSLDREDYRREIARQEFMNGDIKVTILIFFGCGMLFGGLIILATIFFIRHLKFNAELGHVALPQLEGLPDQVARAPLSAQEDKPPSYSSSVLGDRPPVYQEVDGRLGQGNRDPGIL